MLYYNTSFVKNKRERERKVQSRFVLKKRPLKRGKRIIHTQKEMNKKKWTKENQSIVGGGEGKGGREEREREIGGA